MGYSSDFCIMKFILYNRKMYAYRQVNKEKSLYKQSPSQPISERPCKRLHGLLQPISVALCLYTKTSCCDTMQRTTKKYFKKRTKRCFVNHNMNKMRKTTKRLTEAQQENDTQRKGEGRVCCFFKPYTNSFLWLSLLYFENNSMSSLPVKERREQIVGVSKSTLPTLPSSSPEPLCLTLPNNIF